MQVFTLFLTTLLVAKHLLTWTVWDTALFALWLFPLLFKQRQTSPKLCTLAIPLSLIGTLLQHPFILTLGWILAIGSFYPSSLWLIFSLLWIPSVAWWSGIPPIYRGILLLITTLFTCRKCPPISIWSPQKKTLNWISLGCALLLIIAWDTYPLTTADERIQSISLDGETLPLTPYEKQIIQNGSLTKKYYNNQLITILDGTQNRKGVHHPKYCLVGLGWHIFQENEYPTPKGSYTHLTLKKRHETKELIYWYTDQLSHTPSRFAYLWKTFLRRVSFGKSGPEPILIVIQSPSTPSIPPPLLTL